MYRGRFGPPTPVKPILLNIPKDPPDYRTVLVVGHSRGGTSCVAAVLDALGVYMGPPDDLRNNGAYESFVFVHGTPDEKEAEVRRCNGLYRLWGWKQPFGVEALNDLPPGIERLCCVYVMRDPVAATQSYMHHAKVSFRDAAAFVRQRQAEIWEAIETMPYPACVASYERMKSNPRGFVLPLVEFLGLNHPEWVLAEAMARISPRGGYIAN